MRAIGAGNRLGCHCEGQGRQLVPEPGNSFHARRRGPAACGRLKANAPTARQKGAATKAETRPPQEPPIKPTNPAPGWRSVQPSSLAVVLTTGGAMSL